VVEDEFFLALCDVEIGKPAAIAKASPFLAVFILPVPGISWLVIVRNLEGHVSSLVAEPEFVLNDEIENLFVAYCVLVSHYYELLVVLDKLCNVLTE
jgi:hypothetical protein